nr:hypothetical protein [uncultured Mucilaginibacter sp.]
MGKIYKDEEVFELTHGTYFIHDASVTQFDIAYQDYRLCIDVYFTSIQAKRWTKTQIKLRFVDVLEYSFYWNAEHHFYYVERYKFFKTEKGFYISLDPVDETDIAAEEDGDVIISKSIEGYLL